MNMMAIPADSRCSICGTTMAGAGDNPTVIEVVISPLGEMQLIVHWDCLDPETQAEIMNNDRRMKAQMN